MTYKPPTDDVWTPNPGPQSSNPAPKNPWEHTDNVWTPGQSALAPADGSEDRGEGSFDPQGGLVKAWSVSILDSFEECPHRVFLKRVQKAPEPPVKDDSPLERGKKIHKLAEDYIRGELPSLPEELKRYKAGFERLRAKFEEGLVTVEEDWAYNIDWTPVEWMHPQVWARMKLDALEFEDEHSAILIDHKTGKKFGNEIKHNRAGRTYAVGAFMRFPKLEFIRTEFWYLDKNDAPLTNTYTRHNLPIIKPQVEERAIKLTSCTTFHPNPSRSTCRFCPYGNENGTGVCEWAYQGN